MWPVAREKHFIFIIISSSNSCYYFFIICNKIYNEAFTLTQGTKDLSLYITLYTVKKYVHDIFSFVKTTSSDNIIFRVSED